MKTNLFCCICLIAITFFSFSCSDDDGDYCLAMYVGYLNGQWYGAIADGDTFANVSEDAKNECEAQASGLICDEYNAGCGKESDCRANFLAWTALAASPSSGSSYTPDEGWGDTEAEAIADALSECYYWSEAYDCVILDTINHSCY